MKTPPLYDTKVKLNRKNIFLFIFLFLLTVQLAKYRRVLKKKSPPKAISLLPLQSKEAGFRRWPLESPTFSRARWRRPHRTAPPTMRQVRQQACAQRAREAKTAGGLVRSVQQF